jgi:hypothetical protein
MGLFAVRWIPLHCDGFVRHAMRGCLLFWLEMPLW